MTRQMSKPTTPTTALQRRDDQEELQSLPLAGAVQTKTNFQTAVAVQVPRDLQRVENGVCSEAARMGERWCYSWRTKNRDGSSGVVEGETVDASMVLMRNWTNSTCPVEVVQETPTHWIFQATFIDFESGFSIPRLFRQRKDMGSRGRMDKDRLDDIAFQIGQSKAQRNAVLKGMPEWLLDAAREQSKKAAEAKIKNLPDAVETARKHFNGLGVSDDQLVERIGRPFSQWSAKDVVTLRSIAHAHKHRDIMLDDEFPPPPQDVPAQQEPPPRESQPDSPAENQSFDPLDG